MDQKLNKSIKRNILLNPGPATTTVRVKSALIVSDICPREKEFADLVKTIRLNVLKVAKASETDYTAILLGGSGTAAVEAAILNLSNATDKPILIIENGAYGRRIKEICNVYNIPFEALDYPWGVPISLAELEEKLSSNKFGSVAWIHHETTTGILNPFSEVIEIANSHNILTFCDAMSSYACLSIDLAEDKVDYLIASSNKGIHGFAGVGIVIAKKVIIEKTGSKPTKSYYLDLNRYEKQFSADGQFPFTPPVQVLYAMDEALKETLEVTVLGRELHYKKMHEKLLNGMKELGFKPLVKESFHSTVLTAFIEPDGFNFKDYHDHLYKKGMTVYPGKGAKESTFRIANMGDLNPADLDLLLLETANFLKR